MKRRNEAILFVALAASAAGVAGCRSKGQGPPTVPRASYGSELEQGGEYDELSDEDLTFPEDQPWTEAFMQRKALLADFVTIEGPVGLVSHAVARADNDVHLRSVRTTREGLLQEYRVRTDAVASEHATAIRGQLDAWQIMALRRLIILERPGAAAVRIQAKGDVFWRDPATGEEQRGDQLEWVGELAE